MAVFFSNKRSFQASHERSGGDYWPHGDSVNDFSNTVTIPATTRVNWASIIQKLWNGYLKPAIVGESTNGQRPYQPVVNALNRNRHHASHVAIQTQTHRYGLPP